MIKYNLFPPQAPEPSYRNTVAFACTHHFQPPHVRGVCPARTLLGGRNILKIEKRHSELNI